MKRGHYDLSINVDGIKIETVKKKIRVIIDNKLTWMDHVSHIASEVSIGMGIAKNYDLAARHLYEGGVGSISHRMFYVYYLWISMYLAF